MSALLYYSLSVSQIMLAIALMCGAYRMLRGPRAQDRVLGFDSLYISGMLLIVTIGVKTGSAVYFEAALTISLIGFVGTVALAKFLLRGEVIE